MIDFPIVVKLAEPVTVGKETHAEIKFGRYFNVSDLIAMDAVQGSTRQDCAMRASAAGVPIQVFFGMRGSDLRKVREATSALVGELYGMTPDAEPSPTVEIPTGD